MSHPCDRGLRLAEAKLKLFGPAEVHGFDVFQIVESSLEIGAGAIE